MERERYKLFYETVRRGGLSHSETLLKTMMDTAVEVAGADRGFLFLARDGKVSCPVARDRERKDIDAPTEQMSGQILAEAMQAQATLVHDAERARKSPLSASATALGVTSFLAKPLSASGRVVGFGYLDRLRAPAKPFTLEQRAIVNAFFEDMAQLVAAVESRRQTEVEAERLRETVERSRLLPEIVGKDERLLALLQDLEAASGSEASVLILGETGTGKELLAHAIYRLSGRAHKPFLVFNSAAVTPELADSELFGHVRGAFTGAAVDRVGLFEEASGGTLFLDEVGDMRIEVQAKLLRVLENGELRRVGESRPRTTDVRVIAATSRDLGAEVAAGRFRRDLLYRFGVFTLKLPPLRERRGDIPILANHFLEAHRKRYGRRVDGFRKEALEALSGYSWPGNVRELEHAVERAVLLTKSTHIEPEALRLGESVVADEPLSTSGLSIPMETQEGLLSLEDVERRYFRTLTQTLGYNHSEAARIAGLPRTSLLRRLRALGLR